ncbi:MAG: DUF1905 domain-containing protein [Sphingobacteriaceae bacterium]|nr:DUF1905 domain-containing protein [Sphingobacteriaceae bacterium]
MVEYDTVILKFAEKGEKSGWTYIDVPADVAQQLKPGNKKSFRVKGMLDMFKFSGIALLPMGEGDFIMALNADIRKGIRKSEGAMLKVKLEEDHDYKLEAPPELMECLADDPESLEFYSSLAKSHREYFIKWIESAKTDATRTSRIVQMVNAMARKWDYGQMIRENRKIKNG